MKHWATEYLTAKTASQQKRANYYPPEQQEAPKPRSWLGPLAAGAGALGAGALGAYGMTHPDAMAGVSGAVDSIGSAASQLGHGASDLGHRAMDSIGSKAHELGTSANDWLRSHGAFSEKTQDLTSKTDMSPSQFSGPMTGPINRDPIHEAQDHILKRFPADPIQDAQQRASHASELYNDTPPPPSPGIGEQISDTYQGAKSIVKSAPEMLTAGAKAVGNQAYDAASSIFPKF